MKQQALAYTGKDASSIGDTIQSTRIENINLLPGLLGPADIRISYTDCGLQKLLTHDFDFL